LPESAGLPNLCWQVRRAENFRSAPDPYPQFVERCFTYTEEGFTLLGDTVRNLIPCREADDYANTPPWVQMYAPQWAEIPEVGPTSWAAYSDDQFTHRIMGVVSRDGEWLAALASGNSTGMAQAWHDCIHNNAEWEPADAPLLERTWHVKMYAGPKDPEALVARVKEDFPGVDAP
jgi:hypothetical protein